MGIHKLVFAISLHFRTYYCHDMLLENFIQQKLKTENYDTYPYWSKYPPRPSVPKSSLKTICQRENSQKLNSLKCCISMLIDAVDELDRSGKLCHGRGIKTSFE